MYHKIRRGEDVGLTLVEILVMVGALALVLVLTFIALNPGRRFAESRDAARRKDARAVLEAVVGYVADNHGDFPSKIDSDAATIQVIGADTSGCDAVCAGYPAATVIPSCADLTEALVPKYLPKIPTDPGKGTSGDTRYYVNRTPGGRIEVGTCDPELSSAINIKG